MTKEISLEDRFTAMSGDQLYTGMQAVARLLINQWERDRAEGLNTGGYVSGYRGSPLGGLDSALGRLGKFLEPRNILLRPGVNEDLSATAVWWTQFVGQAGDSDYDGVFSLWYGKGPGVDRSGDAFKHANMAGVAKTGGVLALAGDDHGNKSSTIPHQSDFEFLSAHIPVVAPSSIQDFLDFGVYGYALSRFAGLWVGFKMTADLADATGVAECDPFRMRFEPPELGSEFDDRHARLYDLPVNKLGVLLEETLLTKRLPAAKAFIRANPIDRTLWRGAPPTLGIVTTGKSYFDVRRALDILGLDDERAAAARGIGLLKIGLVWPLDLKSVSDFAGDGYPQLLVVEEKRSLIEAQIREGFYGRADAPRLSGKTDSATGAAVFTEHGELSVEAIAAAIVERLPDADDLRARLDAHRAATAPSVTGDAIAQRTAYFCSGCPHNSSTKLPEGSIAFGGIGCHILATNLDRDNFGYTHMGAEGANWIGLAPFTKTEHVFQNMGDGTYFHSGYLAIRAAIAAGVTMTFKILYNDAVAMTGGQAVDGEQSPEKIARQLRAEGVKTIRVVSSDPRRWRGVALPEGVDVSPRSELDQVQRALREVPGVSALIYEQTCATELRRRRKRGLIEEPDAKIFINELVCEGCGDCGVASNCLSIAPVETEFGRKRQIDQSTCNKDMACIDGFCPSFVSVKGGKIRRNAETGLDVSDLPTPETPSLDQPYDILVTGVGGTGVVTIGAILAMAAHIEAKASSVMDMTGLAQKGGSVLSHVRVAAKKEDLSSLRVDAGSADALLACDIVVAAGADALRRTKRGATRGIVNAHDVHTGAFVRNPDQPRFGDDLRSTLETALGAEALDFLDASASSEALLGQSIGANMMTLGAAWQRGLVPISADAISRAIQLNGQAVEMNQKAFAFGRLAVADRAEFDRLVKAARPDGAFGHRKASETLDEVIERRRAFLTEYQDEAYAAEYVDAVNSVRIREAALFGARETLATAVAKNLFKLMACKDEYEVARLYADPAFAQQVAERFEGDVKLTFHLAPPLLAKRDKTTGHLKKRAFGGWMLPAFRLLARFKHLRGSSLDPFGWTDERKTERDLARRYKAFAAWAAENLSQENAADAQKLAELPQRIRGFGHVKEKAIAAIASEQRGLELTLGVSR